MTTILGEKNGIKLVEKKSGDYIVIGKSRVYKYKSKTWATMRYNRASEIYERLV